MFEILSSFPSENTLNLITSISLAYLSLFLSNKTLSKRFSDILWYLDYPKENAELN